MGQVARASCLATTSENSQPSTDARMDVELAALVSSAETTFQVLKISRLKWVLMNSPISHESQACEFVEWVVLLGDTRVQRRMFVIVGGLDDAVCVHSREDSRTVRVLVGRFPP